MTAAPRTDTEDFPFGWPGGLICYFTISPDKSVNQLTYRSDLREYLTNPVGELYAVWPGRYSSDLFRLDANEFANRMGINTGTAVTA